MWLRERSRVVRRGERPVGGTAVSGGAAAANVSDDSLSSDATTYWETSHRAGSDGSIFPSWTVGTDRAADDHVDSSAPPLAAVAKKALS